MDYTVIFGKDISELNAMVNEFIKDGYIPQGGISATITINTSFFFQAMIKKEATKLPKPNQGETITKG